MKIEEIYYYIGFSITWITLITAGIFLTSKLLSIIVDKLSNIFTNWWVIIDYVYYRKDFKEFMKNKKSIVESKVKKEDEK